jgi:hypothetical protein
MVVEIGEIRPKLHQMPSMLKTVPGSLEEVQAREYSMRMFIQKKQGSGVLVAILENQSFTTSED